MTATCGGFIVAEWTRAEGYCDTGLRADTYGKAEAEAARMHRTYGERTRYLPMPVARAVELGTVWRDGQ